MKKLVSLAIVLCMICFVGSPVFALQENFTFTVTPTEKTVKPGDEIEIKLNVSDISEEKGGINAVQGILSQSETNIIEEISLEGKGWSAVINNGQFQDEAKYEREKGIFVISGDTIKTDKQIGTLKVKIKSDAKAGDIGYIYLKEVKASYAKEVSTEDDVTNPYDATIKLTVQADLTPDPTTDPIPDPETDKEPSNDKKTDNTIADKEFSDAGIEKFVLIAIVLGLVTVVAYIKNKNYKVK